MSGFRFQNPVRELHQNVDPNLRFDADYVIIGIGAGGAIMARLLSESKSNSVIALEAGADHSTDPLILDPQYANILPMEHHTEFFNDGTTVPQMDAGGKTLDYIQGKLLGGSSAINGMQYVRGTNVIYNQWQAIAGGDPDWGPIAVNETYKRMENFLNLADVPNPSIHGSTGPMFIRLAPNPETSMALHFAQAVSTATGVPIVVDNNDPANELCAFTRWQLYQHADKTRGNSSYDYLLPVVDPSPEGFVGKSGRQLKVLLNSTVLKILFSGTTAVGVQFLLNGEFASVSAKKKVIVCAGTSSPALLLRSGVGPASVLNTAGVDVVVDSPTLGQRFNNQPIITPSFIASTGDLILPLDDHQALYTGGAFLTDTITPVVGNTRQFQYIGLGVPISPPLLIVAIALLQPASVGTVEIINKDPLQTPLVDDKYYSQAIDLERYRNSLRILQNIETELHLIDPQYVMVNPDPATLADDNLLNAWIFDNMDQCHHWAGACLMGSNISNGVVDSGGNVFGANNLMIADASVAPVQNDGNTSAHAYLIALTIAKKMGYQL